MVARVRPTSVVACGLGSAWLGVHGQIRIMSPEALVSQFPVTKGRIDGTTSMFGAPFYGLRILGRVVFAESPSAHCQSDDYSLPVQSSAGTSARSALINIVMMRRGNCTFVRKVHLAEKFKGAHAAIIVDTEDSGRTRADIARVVIADDGHGTNVNIPSILIAFEDGKRLIDAVASDKLVIVELAWDVPLEPVVVMDLWMSSGSHEANHFLQTFSPRRKALNEAIKFVPHYHVFNIARSTDHDAQKYSSSLCTNNSGLFCADDPDGPGGVTGRMVLEEDVRQLCIHGLANVSRVHADGSIAYDSHKREYAEKYWDYLERFWTECPSDAEESVSAAHRFGLQCSERLARDVGIDIEAVRRCTSERSEELLLQQLEAPAWSPRALRINGWRYAGALDAEPDGMRVGGAQRPRVPHVRECEQRQRQAFVPARPSIRTRAGDAGRLFGVHLAAGRVPPGTRGEPPERPAMEGPGGGVGYGTLCTVVLFVCAVSCGAWTLCRRSVHKQIHRALHDEVVLEVQSQMDSYRQLSGS
ncbi:unnamed protein product [Prorocentrum cordatum]|uniref:PA domain-containing protein n=1 Tax=Prorocentrum cordatum TaxID=2364126 RepID=A0ABN9UIY6_9DINO|nr:unnamed protein product [Polarella glacialis]